MICISIDRLSNSFSVFITSLLNLGSGRLERSVSLFVLSGDFSCSFNLEWFLCFFILLIFLWLYEFRRNSYLLRSWRAVFVWQHPCVASVSLIFLVLWLFLVWMPALCFLSVCWPLSPWEWVWLVVWWPEPVLDVEWGLLFVCGCHNPLRGRVCSPVVGVEAPRSVSELWYKVGGTGVLLLGEETLSIPLQELSTGKCTLWCRLSPIVYAHKVHCCWHCPWPCLGLANTGSHLRSPSGTLLTNPAVQICWHKSAKAKHQDPA